MREYYIELLGEKYLVRIAPRECFSDKWGIEGKCVHIFPGEGEAFSLASCGGEKATSEELFLVGVAHFSAVCKLPRSSLELCGGDETKEVEIFSTDRGVLPLSFLKCKVLYTKTLSFPDLTEHRVATVDCSGHCIRVLLADGRCGFDRGVLPRLLHLGGERACEGSAALFSSGEVMTYPPARRLSALASAAALFGGGTVFEEGRVGLFMDGDIPAAGFSVRDFAENLS